MKSVDKKEIQFLSNQKSCFSNILDTYLDVHKHRIFRGSIFMVLILHLITILIPMSDTLLLLPESINDLFVGAGRIWPLPTFNLYKDQSLYLGNLIVKGLEITVLILYTVDLIPKIFIWQKPVYWKFLNILVITLMVGQVPYSIRQYIEVGDKEQLQIRIFSIGLSFLLLCQILSIREQNTLKLKKINESIKENQRKRIEKLVQQGVKKDEKLYRTFSWLEITKHDNPDDCWVVIDGKVYDITQFLPNHPGGQMILDGAGGECTAMWMSYHPSYLLKKGVPDEFLIGEVLDYVHFYSFENDFYLKVKEAAESKIPKNQRRNDPKLFIKGALWIVLHFVFFYLYIQHGTYTITFLFALFSGQMVVNVMHDGNHISFSNNLFINQMAGYVLDLAFSSSLIYRRSHNYGHHGCVNHLELDRAFDTTFPMIRLHHQQARLGFHKYQHIYTWLVYGFADFGDGFGAFDEMSWFSNYPTRRGFVSQKDFWSQVFTKICWFTFMLFIPAYMRGFWDAFGLFFFFHFIHSYTYVLFFSVNHWTDLAGQSDNSNIYNTNWGILQVENSCNFALDSTIMTHLSGGLNHQIEHHLLPSYAHTRLTEVKDQIQRLCQQHKIRYSNYSTFWSAIQGHYKLLKELGTQD